MNKHPQQDNTRPSEPVRRRTSQSACPAKKALPQRKKRTSLHKRRKIGLRHLDPEYHYYLAKDEGDNISSHLADDYEFVPTADAKNERDIADPSSLGGSHIVQDLGKGEKGVYMRIRKEWYEEDEAERQEAPDEIARKIGIDTKESNVTVKNWQTCTIKDGKL